MSLTSAIPVVTTSFGNWAFCQPEVFTAAQNLVMILVVSPGFHGESAEQFSRKILWKYIITNRRPVEDGSKEAEKRPLWPEGSKIETILHRYFGLHTPKDFLNQSTFFHMFSNKSPSSERQRYWTMSSFFQAAKCGDKVIVQMYLENGYRVNTTDCKRRTALHYACAHGQLPVVLLLLKYNCNVNARDRKKRTPLFAAVQGGSQQCVRMLLLNGADMHHMDQSGNTPLHSAICSGRLRMVQFLLLYGANIEGITTKLLLTPLLLALNQKEADIAKFLITDGANIFALDIHRRNSLIYAIKCDSVIIIQLLLKKGIDIEHRDEFGWTALLYAVMGQCAVRKILWKYTITNRRPVEDGSKEIKEDKNLKSAIDAITAVPNKQEEMTWVQPFRAESESDVRVMQENKSDNFGNKQVKILQQEAVTLPGMALEPEEPDAMDKQKDTSN